MIHYHTRTAAIKGATKVINALKSHGLPGWRAHVCRDRCTTRAVYRAWVCKGRMAMRWDKVGKRHIYTVRFGVPPARAGVWTGSFSSFSKQPWEDLLADRHTPHTTVKAYMDAARAYLAATALAVAGLED